MDYVKAMGIDQSLNATGVVNLQSGKIIAQECIKYDTKKDVLPTYEKINRTCNRVAELVELHQPDYVQMEGLSYGSKGDVHLLAGVLCSITLTLHRMGFSDGTTAKFKAGEKKLWTCVASGRMKAFCLNEGNAKKDTGYLLKVLQRTKLSFADDNIADAYMHGNFVSIVAQVLKGVVPISQLPEWQQETLLKDGLKKGMSLAKALKLSDAEKMALVNIF